MIPILPSKSPTVIIRPLPTERKRMSKINNSQSKRILKWHRLMLMVFMLSSLTFAATAWSQDEPVENSPIVEQDIVEDAAFMDNLGRDTPRSSFIGFLTLSERFDYATAAEYLDLRNLPRSAREFTSEELARQLDFVIKRGMKIDVSHLSKKVTGQVVDGLPDYRDELGHIVSDEGEQVLFMQRVPGLDDNFI